MPRGWARGAASLALLAAMPKCGFCLLGYLGLGAAIGLRSQEFCGSSPDRGIVVMTVCLVAGVVLAALAWWPRRRPRGGSG